MFVTIPLFSYSDNVFFNCFSPAVCIYENIGQSMIMWIGVKTDQQNVAIGNFILDSFSVILSIEFCCNILFLFHAFHWILSKSEYKEFKMYLSLKWLTANCYFCKAKTKENWLNRKGLIQLTLHLDPFCESDLFWSTQCLQSVVDQRTHKS